MGNALPDAGKRIKELRKKKGINQTALAEQLHCNIDTIVNWEKGHTAPSFKSLVELADFFNVPIGNLAEQSALSDKEKKYLKAHRNAKPLSKDEETFLNLLRKASPANKEKVFEILKSEK